MTKDPLELAREVLTLEADAIMGLTKLLDEQFTAALNLLLETSKTGRLVVSGIGKAGFIAQKISATFASTGLPSFFLHPAEAVHGDLGRFTKGDTALILSNSGETEEVIRMLPYIKRRGCPIISLTAKHESTLSTHSDITLCTGAWKEAGPLELAPTTSTTAMLAIGDALAVALQVKQNFTKEQFAEFHPGGSLGRALLTVAEVMRTGDEQCLAPLGTSTREVIQRITETKGRPGAAGIVDANGALVGIFTDGSLRRCLTKETDFLDKPIDEYMTPSPRTIGPEELVQSAERIMTEHAIDQLIVVDDKDTPLGLLDIQDIASIRTR